MNPGKFQNNIISLSQMSTIRGGNDNPIVVGEPIVILPPPREEEKN